MLFYFAQSAMGRVARYNTQAARRSTLAICLAVISIVSPPPARAEVGVDWDIATAAAAWEGRSDFAAVSFLDKLWIMGGDTVSEVASSDVWSSQDGISWTLATDSAPWGPRKGHAAIVKEGKIWILGGTNPNVAIYNDVWCSNDGTNWTLVRESCPWFGRYGFPAASFQNRMWVWGMWYWDDVWSSSNGFDWVCESDDSPWVGRGGAVAAVSDERAFLLGGMTTLPEPDEFLNDVWSTEDGVAWNQEAAAADWHARRSLCGAFYDDAIWLAGGQFTPESGPIVRYDDLWKSTDGKNWTQVAQGAHLQRAGGRAVAHNGRLWIMGGSSGRGELHNDVWSTRHEGPALEVHPKQLIFANVDVDTEISRVLTVSIRNNGDTPIIFLGDGFAISGPDSERFAFERPASTADLDGGTSRTLTLRFTPIDSESSNAILSLTTNDPESPLFIVPMAGNGVRRSAESEMMVETGNSPPITFGATGVEMEFHSNERQASVESVRYSAAPLNLTGAANVFWGLTGPDDGSFSATLRFHYSEEEILGAGIMESSLRLLRSSDYGRTWTPIPCVVDTDLNRVETTEPQSRFSVWALQGDRGQPTRAWDWISFD
jgi:hypothetical protein